MSAEQPTKQQHFTPAMQILNDQQLEDIHVAALEVLEKTGVVITHPKGLEILAEAGCSVADGRVRFPASLVEKAIDSAPKTLALGNRDNSKQIILKERNTFFGATIDCVNYLDPVSGNLEECKSEHVTTMAKLVDTLDNYDWIMTLGIARDKPEQIADREVARIALEHCSKPVIVSCNDAASLKDIHEMAVLCQGGEEQFRAAPILGTLNCTISPLTHDDHLVEKNIYAAENDIPIVHYSGMQLGGSFPATLASGIVMAAAESLSGLVLQQIINSGAPFIFGSFITVMDMKTTIFSYGAIEMAMMVGGMSQLAQRYGLPFFSTGGCTDSKAVDFQAAVESSMQDLVMATVGGGLVHDTHCWLDHGSTLCPEHLVVGQEVLAMAKQFTKGIEVSTETLATDLIDKVGPGGTFLMDPHTMKNFKTVLYPELFQRTKGRAPGSQLENTFNARLKAKTAELMAAVPAKPLPHDIVSQLNSIQEAWRETK